MTENGEIVFITAVATLMAYAVHNEPKIINQRMSLLLTNLLQMPKLAALQLRREFQLVGWAWTVVPNRLNSSKKSLADQKLLFGTGKCL